MVFRRFGGFIGRQFRRFTTLQRQLSRSPVLSGTLPIGPGGAGLLGSGIRAGRSVFKAGTGAISNVLRPFTQAKPVARIGKALAFGQGFSLVAEATESRVTGSPFRPQLLGSRGLATATGFGLAGIPGGVLAGAVGLTSGTVKRGLSAIESARGSFVESPQFMTPLPPGPNVPLSELFNTPAETVFIENTFPQSPIPQPASSSTIIQPAISVGGGGGGGLPLELIMLIMLGLAGGAGFALGKKKKKKRNKKENG